MKRILITGVNGLVGTNFTNSWSANHMLFGQESELKKELAGDIVEKYGVLRRGVVTPKS
jgi:hypothetical protein